MYYWVNQGKTYKEEKEGGYLWAPIKTNNGRSIFHWLNMTKLQPGYIVFNYKKGYLLGYCIIISKCYPAPKPEEFNVDVDWEEGGYMADAEYHLFEKPISKEKIYNAISHLLPTKYSPLNIIEKGGVQKINANQGYLYELNQEIGDKLCKQFNIELGFEASSLINNEQTNYKAPDKTSRRGLVTSRIGQGEYRRRILERWNNTCAVNRSTIKEILIASHIIPWRDSTNKERLDVENGILLSPNYDALFDRHLISFEDNGQIIISRHIDQADLLLLGISGNEKIKALTAKNIEYLKRHRIKLKINDEAK